MPLSLTIVHLYSGGLDSTSLLYELHRQGHSIHCLLCNYGQTHAKELTYAKRHCDRLGLLWTEVDLYRIKNLFMRSALTDGKGGNIVPNRNAVLLHIAAAMAVSMGADTVTFAANKDDQASYPDCTHAFVDGVQETLKAAKLNVQICAPYIGLTKWQIVRRAREFGFPIDDTWSCYAGGAEPCGQCDACNKREGALR